MHPNLDRFIKAQEESYPAALSELENGYKQTHLGLFETLDQAVQARKAAEFEYHTHRLTA